MDNASSSHSILDTLRTVEFRLGLKGYNVDEVDEYLEKAALEAEQVQERLQAASERFRQATERIAQLESELQRSPSEPSALQPSAPAALGEAAQDGAPSASQDALQRTLLLAQKFVEQAKRESEAEAAQVVGRAEERARALLAQAEERARQLTTQAEERLRDEVSRLEASRTRIATDLETMSKRLEEQRATLRATLTEALRWVDETMQAAPAQAAPAQGAPAQGAPEKGPEGREGRPPGQPATGNTTPSPVVSTGARSAGGPSAPVPPRPQVAVPASAPSPAPSVERPQSPVGARLGILHGGLFEAARGEANGFEENRHGD